MKNYYERERYPYWLIHDFVTNQRNLSEAQALTAAEVAENRFLYNNDKLCNTTTFPFSSYKDVDLSYWFTDAGQDDVPALCFLKLEYDPEQDEDPESTVLHYLRHANPYDVYDLVYIDPSLDGLWKSETNKERDR